MYKTIAELNKALSDLSKEYHAKIKPLEDMFEEIYEAQMAACDTLDERWEVYLQCNSNQLNFVHWGSDRDTYVVKDFIIHYDVFDQEIKEPYRYNLIDWIDNSDAWDDEYIRRHNILKFFEQAENTEIEVYSNITRKYISIKLPKHIINAWKEMIIKEKTNSIYLPREW